MRTTALVAAALASAAFCSAIPASGSDGTESWHSASRGESPAPRAESDGRLVEARDAMDVSVSPTTVTSATPTQHVPRAAHEAGGLTVTEPAQTADPSYYKIAAHETITFGWSFTSLSKTLSRLYVVASCSSNSNTYPIAPSPKGINGDATKVEWYPYGYGKSAHAHGDPDLVAGKYRLIIYGDAGPSAVPKAGELTPNNQVEFSLYYPQAYTPLASAYMLTEWHCSSCSGASGPSPAVGLFSACLVALLSAAWLVVHP